MEDQQSILGELRQLRRGQEEIVLQLRIDTPWIRAREHMDYALKVVSAIPFLARLCIFAGVCLTGAGVLTHSLKTVFLGVDMLFLSLLFVGSQP